MRRIDSSFYGDMKISDTTTRTLLGLIGAMVVSDEDATELVGLCRQLKALEDQAGAVLDRIEEIRRERLNRSQGTQVSHANISYQAQRDAPMWTEIEADDASLS